MITALTGNAGSQADAISSLQSNAASQAGLITALTGNAGSQADAITSLQSNAGVQADAISVLQGNIVSIGTILLANVAANALTQHNSIVALTSQAETQADAIIALTGNALAQHNSIIGANAAIVTANTSMKSYVDAQTAAVTTALTVSRTAVVATPTVLTSNVGGNIDITGFKGYALYSIGTSANTTANVWVTIYSNLAARVTDYSRLVGESAPTGTGIIAQTINIGNVTQFFTPAVYGFNNEATANTNIPLKATVTSNNTANVTVTVTMLKLEN